MSAPTPNTNTNSLKKIYTTVHQKKNPKPKHPHGTIVPALNKMVSHKQTKSVASDAGSTENPLSTAISKIREDLRATKESLSEAGESIKGGLESKESKLKFLFGKSSKESSLSAPPENQSLNKLELAEKKYKEAIDKAIKALEQKTQWESELIERDHYDYPEHCRLEHACHQSNFEVIKAEIAVLKASPRKDNYRSVLKILIETGVQHHSKIIETLALIKQNELDSLENCISKSSEQSPLSNEKIDLIMENKNPFNTISKSECSIDHQMMEQIPTHPSEQLVSPTEKSTRHDKPIKTDDRIQSLKERLFYNPNDIAARDELHQSMSDSSSVQLTAPQKSFSKKTNRSSKKLTPSFVKVKGKYESESAKSLHLKELHDETKEDRRLTAADDLAFIQLTFSAKRAEYYAKLAEIELVSFQSPNYETTLHNLKCQARSLEIQTRKKEIEMLKKELQLRNTSKDFEEKCQEIAQKEKELMSLGIQMVERKIEKLRQTKPIKIQAQENNILSENPPKRQPKPLPKIKVKSQNHSHLLTLT